MDAGETSGRRRLDSEAGERSSAPTTRFLDLREGLAPDKFTAEVRKVTRWWSYDPKLQWRDGETIDRTLRWPEVDREVRNLPKGTRRVYLRYRMQGLAVDSLRLAVVRTGLRSASPLQVTHVWKKNGKQRQQVERIPAGEPRRSYRIVIPAAVQIQNEALILECPDGA
jgi:hypothetical protein